MGLGRPCGSTGSVADIATVQIVEIEPGIVDEVAGDRAIRLAAIVGDRQPAAVAEVDVSLDVIMVVAALGRSGGGEQADCCVRRCRLIR